MCSEKWHDPEIFSQLEGKQLRNVPLLPQSHTQNSQWRCAYRNHLDRASHAPSAIPRPTRSRSWSRSSWVWKVICRLFAKALLSSYTGLELLYCVLIVLVYRISLDYVLSWATDAHVNISIRLVGHVVILVLRNVWLASFERGLLHRLRDESVFSFSIWWEILTDDIEPASILERVSFFFPFVLAVDALFTGGVLAQHLRLPLQGFFWHGPWSAYIEGGGTVELLSESKEITRAKWRPTHVTWTLRRYIREQHLAAQIWLVICQGICATVRKLPESKGFLVSILWSTVSSSVRTYSISEASYLVYCHKLRGFV